MILSRNYHPRLCCSLYHVPVSDNMIFSRGCSHTIRPRAVGDWRGKMEEGK